MFHEYVHVLQNQEGRYPAQYADGTFIKTTYTFRYHMDYVNAKWEEFYESMDVAGIPRVNRNEYQQKYWDYYKSIRMNPVIEKQQYGETYTDEQSYELIKSEIEAYEWQIREYGSRMSLEILRWQQAMLESYKQLLDKINNKAIK